uniref:Putative ATPase domain containing protein n=1 Tax=viral metagenome TaxID=1070528 RepID=A0A6M3JJK1_9ZZZZ
MQIKLNRLRLENFKGVRYFTLDPSGESVTIRGDNGTGKTTTMDAFLWLLFGKDSQGKSDFAVKTLNPDGTEIHNLNHLVEVELQIDERENGKNS